MRLPRRRPLLSAHSAALVSQPIPSAWPVGLVADHALALLAPSCRSAGRARLRLRPAAGQRLALVWRLAAPAQRRHSAGAHEAAECGLTLKSAAIESGGDATNLARHSAWARPPGRFISELARAYMYRAARSTGTSRSRLVAAPIGQHLVLSLFLRADLSPDSSEPATTIACPPISHWPRSPEPTLSESAPT